MHATVQPTIWEVPDDVWTMIEPILDECYPAKPKGHRRVALRRVLNGIIFRLRTGCQWNQLPTQFGDDSTVHRHFQQWCQRGIMARMWAVLVEACDALGGVDWQWQAADAAMGKARMGGDLVGRNPTDRGEQGVKRSVVVDATGGPLGGHHCWGQCPRHQVAGRHPGGYCRGAPPAECGEATASLPGQRL